MTHDRIRKTKTWPVYLLIMMVIYASGYHHADRRHSARVNRNRRSAQTYYRVVPTRGSTVIEWATDLIGTATAPAWEYLERKGVVK